MDDRAWQLLMSELKDIKSEIKDIKKDVGGVKLKIASFSAIIYFVGFFIQKWFKH